MADLNKDMNRLQDRFLKIEIDLKNLLNEYDGLYRDINWNYLNERNAAKSTEGLEEFHKLLQIVKRNKDIMGSLIRGCNGIQRIDRFKFIEEDTSPAPLSKVETRMDRKRKTQRKSSKIESTIEAEIAELV